MSAKSLLIAGLAPVLMLAFLPASSRAAESYDNCSYTITLLPTLITSQGTWCMKGDLSANMANGSAITVSTNNVIIDCNGFKLGNLAAGPTNGAVGISASAKANVTVRNCNLRGWNTAAFLSGSGHVVEDSRVENSGYTGLDVRGDGSAVRRNTVIDTGTGVFSPYAAILVEGVVDVMDNVVVGVAQPEPAVYNAIGIFVSNAAGGRVEGNAVRSLVPDLDGLAYGIFIDNNGGGVSLARNRINSSGTLVDGSGIQCAGASPSFLVDNHMTGFANGQVGCVDVGLNYTDSPP